MQDLFQIAKQWVGLGGGNNAGGMSPGIVSLAGLFGGDTKSKRASQSRKSNSGLGGLFGSKDEPISSRTRNAKAGTGSNSDPDIFSSLLKSATNLAGDAGDGDWQGIVQDYVKNAVLKASGLDWLLGKKEDEADGGRRGTR